MVCFEVKSFLLTFHMKEGTKHHEKYMYLQQELLRAHTPHASEHEQKAHGSVVGYV